MGFFSSLFGGGTDSTARSAEKGSLSFMTQLQGAFGQAFANNQNILSFLNNKLTSMATNPTGFLPAQMTAMTTGAIQNTAQQVQNAQQASNLATAARGGNGLPSGVQAQTNAAINAAGANQLSNEENQIQIENADQTLNNQRFALSGLAGVASEENPNGYSSSANGAAGAVAGLSNAVSNSENSGFMGALSKSLGAGVSGTIGDVVGMVPGLSGF
jgi:hypothetical protein